MNVNPAYITIVEGPPPEFEEVVSSWTNGILESQVENQVALVEMRTFDGPKLVKRCQDAWANGRPARLNFPTGDGARGELDIVAARWESVSEGHKLYLWVRIDAETEVDEGPMALL
ncbi:MAG: hypothetical protein ACE5G8_09050 [Anaerolineae bacterium]